MSLTTLTGPVAQPAQTWSDVVRGKQKKTRLSKKETVYDSTVNQKKSEVKPVPKQAPKISVQVKRQRSVWTRLLEMRKCPKMRARTLKVSTQPEEWFHFVAVPQPAKPLWKVQMPLAKRSPKSPVQVKRECVVRSRPVDVKTAGKVMETITKQAPSRSKPIQTKIAKFVDVSTTVKSMRHMGKPAFRQQRVSCCSCNINYFMDTNSIRFLCLLRRGNSKLNDFPNTHSELLYHLSTIKKTLFVWHWLFQTRLSAVGRPKLPHASLATKRKAPGWLKGSRLAFWRPDCDFTRLDLALKVRWQFFLSLLFLSRSKTKVNEVKGLRSPYNLVKSTWTRYPAPSAQNRHIEHHLFMLFQPRITTDGWAINFFHSNYVRNKQENKWKSLKGFRRRSICSKRCNQR